MSQSESILSNPTLGYRLDPYEPGFIRRAKASQSTPQVVSHEHRNLTRLTRQAIQEGRVVIGKHITYKPTIAGSYMGTAAGKTTVVSVEKNNAVEENQPNEPSDKRQDLSSGEVDQDERNLPGPVEPELQRMSLEELSREEQKLRSEIHRIAAEIERLEDEKDRPSSQAESVNAEDRIGKLKVQLEQRERDLQDVSLARILKSQSELSDAMNEALSAGFRPSISMIGQAYAGKGNVAGQKCDLFA